MLKNSLFVAKAIMKSLKSGRFDKEKSNTAQISKELDHMSEKFSELSARKENLVHYASLFSMNPPDFTAFTDTQKELDFQCSKWEILTNFRENADSWMKGSCSGLDIEDIQSKVLLQNSVFCTTHGISSSIRCPC